MQKLAQILLYVVLGISVLVIVFFYFGNRLIDVEAYEAKVEQLEAPEDMTTGFDFEQDMAAEEDTAVADTSAVDTTAAAGADTAEVEEAPVAEEISEPMEPEVASVDLSFYEKMVYKKTDIALSWGYILVILSALVAIGFSVFHLFENPATMVRTLISLVFVAILVGLAYLFGSESPVRIPGYTGTDNRDPQVLRYVDTGLITMYFFLGLALLSILYSEIAKYFK